MSNQPAEMDTAREHLEDVEDGAGCTEIWERLTEERAQGEAAED